jgi:hypothetical protein
VSDGDQARGSSTRGRRRAPRRPISPLPVFATGFALLLAAAVCVGVGNFRPNSTFLPVLSFYLSGAAIVLTVVALALPARRPTPGEPKGP